MVIGELPNDVVHRILECIPIEDAARISVLSKHWVHAASTFFQYASNKGASPANIIHKILMQHAGIPYNLKDSIPNCSVRCGPMHNLRVKSWSLQMSSLTLEAMCCLIKCLLVGR